ncbi:SDR family oxidoreductase [Prochlorococcus marinus]|uniref:SDR family oxidoreductase n=1 Tax=Prochlorococcus marinus TaxID=1219 RepID=UPI0022B5223D|nr:SDR family oxidoreductase [Prochlorococcus marinus]
MFLFNLKQNPQNGGKCPWKNKRIGITGASGSLGIALTKIFRSKGAYVIGFTHSLISKQFHEKDAPNEWIKWKSGEEEKLNNVLETIDILILNHGINPGRSIETSDLNKALEVNALTQWRLIEKFEHLTGKNKNSLTTREIWVNTSEAEVQPAFSPAYEMSKRLIGELISFKWFLLLEDKSKKLKIKKLILGPFRSNLNPIGIMDADFVANQIINQAKRPCSLIIVTPNPLTYFLLPLNELIRFLYIKLIHR